MPFFKKLKRKLSFILAFFFVFFCCAIPAFSANTRYVTVPVAHEILTAEEISTIQAHGTYTVGYLDDFTPLSYVNSEGEMVGTAMDALTSVGDSLNLSFHYVNLSSPTADTSNIDIILIPSAVDNAQSMQHSAAYLTVPYVIVHAPQVKNNTALPIGILAYFELTAMDINTWLSDSPVVTFQDFTSMNEAFAAGDIKSMVLTSARFNNVKNDITTEDYTLDILQSEYDCTFTFPATFPSEKIEILNKMLLALDNEQLNYSLLNHSTYSTVKNISFWAYVKAHPSTVLQVGLTILFFVSTLIAILVNMADRKRKRDLTNQLNIDELTGLCTLHFFQRELARLLKKPNAPRYTIFIYDIDNFKYVNEIYGYRVGSQMLQQFGDFMKTNIPNAPLIARVFADEFLILHETGSLALTDWEIGHHAMTYHIDAHSALLGNDYTYSLSVGYYHITDPTLNISYMIDCARLAKNLGKRTAHFTIHEFTPHMAAEYTNNNNIVADMGRGITNKEFILHYQPQINLQTGKMVGAEALVRWQHQSKMMSPAAFIPLFEKNSFIVTLDYYVLQEVCDFIKVNEDYGLPPISVNLSVVTLMSENLVENILRIVEQAGVTPQQLDFEITETAFAHSITEIAEKVQCLRTAGFTIAMDDFGVGISSLSLLKSIPIDTIKIDRKFIVDSLKSEKGSTIVMHIIQMAKALHLETVAEGLETKAQISFFQDLGCDVGQGYYYARPLPGDDFLALFGK